MGSVITMFLWVLRSGEVTVSSDTAFDDATHITFNDVAVDRLKEPTMVRARLKTSKTNPFRKGVDIVVGKTGDTICLVSAVLNYLLARGAGVLLQRREATHKGAVCLTGEGSTANSRSRWNITFGT